MPQWDGVYFYVRMTGTTATDTELYVLEEAPTLLFLTLYSHQLLIWAKSYHTTVGSLHTYEGPVRWTIVIFNVFAYCADLLIWILYDRTQGAVSADAWSLCSAVLQSIYFILVAIAMCVYGVLVRNTLQSVPIGLHIRLRQMRQVAWVTGACTLAFLIRSIAIVSASYAGFVNLGGFDDSITTTDVSATVVFFMATEVLPLVVVLRFNGRGSRASTSSATKGTSSRFNAAIGAASGTARSPYRTNRVGSASRLGRSLQSMRFSFSPTAGAELGSDAAASPAGYGFGGFGSSPRGPTGPGTPGSGASVEFDSATASVYSPMFVEKGASKGYGSVTPAPVASLKPSAAFSGGDDEGEGEGTRLINYGQIGGGDESGSSADGLR